MKHKHKLIIFIVSLIIVIIGIICIYWDSKLNKSDNNIQLKDSYSQFGQDIDIIEYLNNKKDGYFVDIGATNGIDISNTYLLEEGHNWNGICIEPQENYYKQLIKNRNCHTDNSLLFSEKGKLVDFSEAGDLGGITSYIDKHTDAKNSKQIKLTTETLTNILVKYNAPTTIDYMSLDTEGSELEILKGIDFDTYKFGIMTIEHNHVEPRRSDIRTFLEEKGYKFYKEKGVDDYYVLFKFV